MNIAALWKVIELFVPFIVNVQLQLDAIYCEFNLVLELRIIFVTAEFGIVSSILYLTMYVRISINENTLLIAK